MLENIITRQTPNTSTNLYALVMKVKKTVSFTMHCKIVQADYNNYNFKNISIVSTGSAIKIFDENIRNKGIKVALINDTENYYLYVNGNLIGNQIRVFINECNNLNYIELINNSRFNKDISSLNANESTIAINEYTLNNIPRTAFTLDTNWTTTRAFYTIKNGICFINLRGTSSLSYKNGLVIVNGLPKPNTFDGEPLMDIPCYYKGANDADYKVCRAGIDANGNLKIYEAPSGAVFSSIMIETSYPTRN